MQFTVVSGGSDSSGDTDQFFKGPRNELVTIKENGVAKEYTIGDNRYYRWRTHFPADFPEPPLYIEGAPPAFNVFFQFHAHNLCAGDVPLTVELKRTDTSMGRHTGGFHQIVLTADGNYSETIDDETRLWPSGGGAPIVKGVGSDGQLKWYDFVLHVYWSDVPCSGGLTCDWLSPDGGLIEFWVDGQLVFQEARKTMDRWPVSALCMDDEPFDDPGAAMTNYLKVGLYRDYMLTDSARIMTDDIRIADACGPVWPGGCPRP